MNRHEMGSDFVPALEPVIRIGSPYCAPEYETQPSLVQNTQVYLGLKTLPGEILNPHTRNPLFKSWQRCGFMIHCNPLKNFHSRGLGKTVLTRSSRKTGPNVKRRTHKAQWGGKLAIRTWSLVKPNKQWDIWGRKPPRRNFVGGVSHKLYKQ